MAHSLFTSDSRMTHEDFEIIVDGIEAFISVQTVNLYWHLGDLWVTRANYSRNIVDLTYSFTRDETRHMFFNLHAAYWAQAKTGKWVKRWHVQTIEIKYSRRLKVKLERLRSIVTSFETFKAAGSYFNCFRNASEAFLRPKATFCDFLKCFIFLSTWKLFVRFIFSHLPVIRWMKYNFTEQQDGMREMSLAC